MGAESDQYALPAELDTYMQESIFHMLGFCTWEDNLNQKLSKAEESYQDLALQMQHVQLRLRELEYKRAKSKEEAVLNAQALKRQVAESQKLAEQHRALKVECTRLENECALFEEDRDKFMEQTYEAEDRAAEAEDRAAEAERKNQTLIDELERVRKALAEDGRITLEMDYTDYVASLKIRITELEEQNFRLQEEIQVLHAERQYVMSASFSEFRAPPDAATLQALLLEAKEKCEEAGRELRSLQEKYDKEVASKRDERAVNQMVSAAVTAGICKALEEEKEDSLNAINLEFSSIFRCMESELGGSRERVIVAESNFQALLQEAQALRQEAALCRGNLDKAEVEVQMLADENKELRVLLRRRYAGPESPMHNKGNKGGRSQSGGRPRSKTHEGHGEESICALCNARQPLMPLPGNSQERKLNRRQNLTVDGNFCSRSPSSPSLEISPGSIFQD
ncbi:unnamed protein product [Calypogeia fissa]